jgi:hypothetical protein
MNAAPLNCGLVLDCCDVIGTWNVFTRMMGNRKEFVPRITLWPWLFEYALIRACPPV